MRLLNIETLRLESYENADKAPPYAILSHAWEQEEVLFNDLQDQPHHKDFRDLKTRFDDLQSRFDDLELLSEELLGRPVRRRQAASGPQSSKHLDNEERVHKTDNRTESEDPRLSPAKQKKGWSKIEGCCREAAKFGLDYVWIDTCCICKDSSTELSEAINSMFAWYRDAKICFAYLSDASSADGAFRPSFYPDPSNWFSRGCRGWTLQELIAPVDVFFYQREWILLGQRSTFGSRIEEITGISERFLSGSINEEDSSLSVAKKLSWSAHRQTTRPEDRAYSLMGIFSVNMPIIYEKKSGDHSIFAWCRDPYQIIKYNQSDAWNFDAWETEGLFAPSPDCYAPHLDDSFSESPINLDGTDDVGYPGAESLPDTEVYSWIRDENNQAPPHQADGPSYVAPSRRPQYNAFLHGMPVQMLLKFGFLARGDGSAVFLAYLACKNKHLQAIPAIYLLLTREGQYRRIHPNTLVAIGPKDLGGPTNRPEKFGLKLTDVYITSPKFDPKARKTPKPIMKQYLGVTVNLTNPKLTNSGFNMSDYSPAQWQLAPGKTHLSHLEWLRSSDGEGRRLLLPPCAIIFRNVEKGEAFGLVFKLRQFEADANSEAEAKLQAEAGIVMDLTLDSTAEEMMSTERGWLQRLNISMGDSRLLVMLFKPGKYVILEVTQDRYGIIADIYFGRDFSRL